jgi:hypothetical protein
MLGLICSTGFEKSLTAATTRPQFAMGPQKCTVFGPVGEFRKARNDADIVALFTE